MIEVETLADSVRVTIPQAELNQTQLEEMLSWLRLASAARRSGSVGSGQGRVVGAEQSAVRPRGTAVSERRVVMDANFAFKVLNRNGGFLTSLSR